MFEISKISQPNSNGKETKRKPNAAHKKAMHKIYCARDLDIRFKRKLCRLRSKTAEVAADTSNGSITTTTTNNKKTNTVSYCLVYGSKTKFNRTSCIHFTIFLAVSKRRSHCHSFILSFKIFFSLCIFRCFVICYILCESGCVWIRKSLLVSVVYPFWIWCVYALNWYRYMKTTHIVAKWLFILWLLPMLMLHHKPSRLSDPKKQNNEYPFFFHSCALCITSLFFTLLSNIFHQFDHQYGFFPSEVSAF